MGQGWGLVVADLGSWLAQCLCWQCQGNLKGQGQSRRNPEKTVIKVNADQSSYRKRPASKGGDLRVSGCLTEGGWSFDSLLSPLEAIEQVSLLSVKCQGWTRCGTAHLWSWEMKSGRIQVHGHPGLCSKSLFQRKQTPTSRNVVCPGGSWQPIRRPGLSARWFQSDAVSSQCPKL